MSPSSTKGASRCWQDRYDLDYLVTERELDLRLVHQEGVLRLYRLE